MWGEVDRKNDEGEGGKESFWQIYSYGFCSAKSIPAGFRVPAAIAANLLNFEKEM